MIKTYFDIFTGSGVASLVMDKYNLENVGYSEIDKFAIQNYDANFLNRRNYGDISKIGTEEITNFDLLIGGSPCQDISIMRKTWTENNQPEGLKGEESMLFFEYVRILNEKLPKYFIFENVRNLLYSNNGEDFQTVCELFEENYNIKYQVLNTADYGLPQTRRRVWIVGQRKDLGGFDFEFPKPFELKIKVHDLLENDVDDKYYLSQKMYDYVMANGTKGWSAKPEADLEIARPLTATMHKMHRASTDNYYHTKHQPKGKTNLRKITPTECARLQGLPDTYEIVVSDTQAYRLMGNAMSYNVLDAIMRELIRYQK